MTRRFFALGAGQSDHRSRDGSVCGDQREEKAGDFCPQLREDEVIDGIFCHALFFTAAADVLRSLEGPEIRFGGHRRGGQGSRIGRAHLHPRDKIGDLLIRQRFFGGI